MKIILTMLVLAFATQVSAGSSCGTSQNNEDSMMLGAHGHGTWQNHSDQ